MANRFKLGATNEAKKEAKDLAKRPAQTQRQLIVMVAVGVAAVVVLSYALWYFFSTDRQKASAVHDLAQKVKTEAEARTALEAMGAKLTEKTYLGGKQRAWAVDLSGMQVSDDLL